MLRYGQPFLASTRARHDDHTGVHVEVPHADAISMSSEAGADDVVLPLALEDPLASIRDDVDEQVLPIFLDEAAELFPRAGEELRAWRRNPHDGKPVSELRRTLHTLKGSARMAGAMRLGQLTHLMESDLVLGDTPAGSTPEYFEALETSLDRIAFVLDRLRSGETNTRLPWVAEAPDEDQVASIVDVAPVAAPAPPVASIRWSFLSRHRPLRRGRRARIRGLRHCRQQRPARRLHPW